ncbi:MAG TPA: hypothetical protein VEM32_09850 [Geobacteraceae bacterium]|nr:hypothetical protein [Geobacteraceae bacterium]
MDKLCLLKAFEKQTFKVTLESDEILLYLLLLADCDSSGDGRIESAAIDDALGEGFPAVRLKQACRRLSGHNIIEVVSPDLDEINAENFTMFYRLVPLAKWSRQ